MKVYIIGSVNESHLNIRYAAHIFETLGHEVRYVEKKPEVPIMTLIHDCFLHIDSWADLIVVVPKSINNGVLDIGTGTMYEIEHAKSMGKPVVIFAS